MEPLAGHRLWTAVEDRDRTADGLFVYAVTSTRIYCRPSCPSRRPRRERVEFFPTPAAAVAGGYRACRRCHPDGPVSDPGTDLVARACRAVAAAPDRAWSVPAMARAAGGSVARVQRAFRDRLGLSPREFAAACRQRSFLVHLRSGVTVTQAVYEAGYGSASRAYESRALPGMTPATYGRGGLGATITWTVVRPSLGRILVATTARGVCFVEVGADDETLLRKLRQEFPRATIAPRPSSALRGLAAAVRAVADAKPWSSGLPLDIQGTAFQWRVWKALTRIPVGETRSYSEVARAIGSPASVRAVARACATNPVALLIPCHRVVGATGDLRGYRWGMDVKARLLARERQG